MLYSNELLIYTTDINSIEHEKFLYRKNCQFKFSPYIYPKIIGFELLAQYQMSHRLRNPNGLHRDHMISISYGWENNIPAEVISHPANCAILFAKDNISKGSGCSITLDQLKERIDNWYNADNDEFILGDNTPRTAAHNQKISDYNKTLKIYTNGITNVKQDKNLPIPIGFHPGMTKTPLSPNERQKASNKIADANKTCKVYTDGVSNIRQNKNLPIPLGFWPGITRPDLTETQKQQRSVKQSNNTKDLRKYTNGIINIRRHKDLPIPTGFWLGRTKLLTDKS
jgi:hypothetical protein